MYGQCCRGTVLDHQLPLEGHSWRSSLSPWVCSIGRHGPWVARQSSSDHVQQNMFNVMFVGELRLRAGLVRVHREVSPDPRRRGSRFEASAQGHRSTARVRLLRLHRRTAGVFEAGSFMAQRPRCQWTSASPWHGPAVATSRAMQRSGAASTKSLTTSSGASHCERGDSHAPLTGACDKPWLDSKTPGDPP